MKIEIAPGAFLWNEYLSEKAQRALLAGVLERIEKAPFYRPAMPKSGHPLSVQMSNFGTLGWVTDKERGYRYEPRHPVTNAPWPGIPAALLEIWSDLANYPAPPEACLVNLYRGTARMGLHRDSDEDALDAPVLSVSLGDTALFRFGGASRRDRAQSLKLVSGDVLVMGGPARFAFHGIERIHSGTSTLVPGGGRINLTLRRVTIPSAKTSAKKATAGQGV